MTTVSVPDFTAIINDLVKTQGDLTERLTHLEELFDYMLTSDFTQVKPSALQAQLISMDKLIRETKAMSENGQKCLSQLLPQPTDLEKS